MNKEQFISALMLRIGRLPPEEIRRAKEFYEQAIDDRVEDGMTEEEAVAALGPMDEIVREIESSVPLSSAIRARVENTKKRAKEAGGASGWIVALAIIGFPLWITLFSVFFAVVVTLFSLIIAFFAVMVSLIAAGSGVAALAWVLPYPGIAPKLTLFGAGLVVLGLGLLSIPLYTLTVRSLKAALKGCVWLVKRLIMGRKEAAA